MITVYSQKWLRIVQAVVFGLGLVLPLAIMLMKGWSSLAARILVFVR